MSDDVLTLTGQGPLRVQEIVRKMRRHSPRRQKRPECLRMPLRPHGCARNGLARRRIGGKNMANLKFDKEITALLVIDPYNDFISEGGKVWDRLRGVAEANNCVPNMLQVLNAARRAELRVFYALHHRYRPGDYETWKYIAPIQKAAWLRKSFEDGTWGGASNRECDTIPRRAPPNPTQRKTPSGNQSFP
jgi:Isochorismatase family